MALQCYLVSRLGEDNKTSQSRNLMPTDWFTFKVNVVYRSTHLNHTNDERFSVDIPTVDCKSFFGQEGGDFLRTHLSSLPHFTLELLEQTIPAITSKVKRLFGNDSELENPLGLQPHLFQFYLDFMFDVLDGNHEGEVVEESMQQVAMIPASKHDIKSLKTFKATKHTKYCTICLEEFNVNGDGDDITRISTMPCNHVFHQQCIEPWLQTNHTCPLCRYPMPKTSRKYE